MTDAVSSSAPATTTPVQPTAQVDKLKAVAKQFEAVFLRQMIGSMRQASPGDGIFDSEATKQFQDMSDAKTADNMADKGALGIADLLIKQYGARLSPIATPATATPDAGAGTAK